MSSLAGQAPPSQEEESGLTVTRAQDLDRSRFRTPTTRDPSTSAAQSPRRTLRSAGPPTAISLGALEKPLSFGEEPQLRSESPRFMSLRYDTCDGKYNYTSDVSDE